MTWARTPHHFPPAQTTMEIVMFSMIWGVGRGGRHHPFPQKTMETIMFSMILRWGAAPCHLPAPKNYRNHYVYHDFVGGAGRPVTSHLLKQSVEIIMFPKIWGVGRGPSPPPTTQKTIGYLYVFNDFGCGAGPPSPPTSSKIVVNHNVFQWFLGWGVGQRPRNLPPPKKLWKS